MNCVSFVNVEVSLHGLLRVTFLVSSGVVATLIKEYNDCFHLKNKKQKI